MTQQPGRNLGHGLRKRQPRVAVSPSRYVPCAMPAVRSQLLTLSACALLLAGCAAGSGLPAPAAAAPDAAPANRLPPGPAIHGPPPTNVGDPGSPTPGTGQGSRR